VNVATQDVVGDSALAKSNALNYQVCHILSLTFHARLDAMLLTQEMNQTGFDALAEDNPSVCDALNLMDACMEEEKVVVSLATGSGVGLVADVSSEESHFGQLAGQGEIAMLGFSADEDEEAVDTVFASQDQALDAGKHCQSE